MLRKKSIRRFDCRLDVPTLWPQKSSGQAAKAAAPSERASARLEARLVASVELSNGCHVGFTENLSEGGAFVATRAPHNVGDEVGLVIALPDLALIRARGTVRWLRTPCQKDGTSAGMGVRFERLSPLDAVRIQDFMATRRSLLVDDATGVRALVRSERRQLG
jgi:uncharacterized protein (TIGR02266 family)